MDKLNGLTMDLEAANNGKLRAVFPERFTEGQLDIDKLLSLRRGKPYGTKPKYEPLKGRFLADTAAVHDRYFSQDKKGNYKNTRGDTQDDTITYH